MADTYWRTVETAAEADAWLVDEEGCSFCEKVARIAAGALFIEDFDAAKDRLIAHAQLLGFDEFDNAALADEYADELLHAAVGK